MGRNRTLIILFFILFCLMSLIIGFLLNVIIRTSWTYSYVVEPIDIINIVITTSVTIFVAWFITKQISEERFEKELVISDLKSIEICIESMLKSYEEGKANEKILASINQLYILINRFEKTISFKKIDISTLQAKFWQLYSTATDYTSSENVDSINLPAVQAYSDDLIVEIRKTIGKINSI